MASRSGGRNQCLEYTPSKKPGRQTPTTVSRSETPTTGGSFGTEASAKARPTLPAAKLTQSEYYSTLWELEDSFDPDTTDLSNAAEAFEDLASELESQADEIEDKKSNMESYNLTEGDSYQLLEMRSEALQTLIEEAQSAKEKLSDDLEMMEGIREEALLEAEKAGAEFDQDEWEAKYIEDCVTEAQESLSWEIE